MQVQWNRAARTDKGVHAAGQVISFKALLPVAGGEAELVAATNAKCPPDMRVIEIVRTIQSFNSKNLCS